MDGEHVTPLPWHDLPAGVEFCSGDGSRVVHVVAEGMVLSDHSGVRESMGWRQIDGFDITVPTLPSSRRRLVNVLAFLVPKPWPIDQGQFVVTVWRELGAWPVEWDLAPSPRATYPARVESAVWGISRTLRAGSSLAQESTAGRARPRWDTVRKAQR